MLHARDVFSHFKPKDCTNCLYFKPEIINHCVLSQLYNIAEAPCTFGNASTCQSYTPIISNVPPMDKPTCSDSLPEKEEEDYTKCENCYYYLGDNRCMDIKEEGLNTDLRIIDIDTKVKGKCIRYKPKTLDEKKRFSPIAETDFEDFCEDCRHMDVIATCASSTLISDNEKYSKNTPKFYVRCKHLSACKDLYRRFNK